MNIEYEARKVIDRLKKSAEETTGESYNTLTEAHQALKNGYGQSDSAESFVGITDFTDFWSSGKNMAVYDKIDTSEGVIFDRLLYLNRTINKLPKYLKVTNKATSLVEMFDGCYELKELPETFDTSNCTNFNKAFSNCGITDLSKINTSSGVDFNGAFYRQYGTKEIILPDVVDMTNATTANSMCFGSYLNTFPFVNTEKVTAFREAFKSCRFTEAELDLTSCTDMRSCFNGCTRLTTLTLRNTQNIASAYWNGCFTSCSALTNLNIDYLNVTNNQLDFSTCTKLTVESLVNILNAFSDNTGLSTTYTVKLGATNLAKLTAEQKQIATNKNIALA